MKKSIFAFVFCMCFVGSAYARQYIKTTYSPLSQQKCLEYKSMLGLKFCPVDGDHLAGAALACGHISNLPTKDELQQLAQYVYHKRTSDTTIYGDRDEYIMDEFGLWENDSHIYFWIGEEAKDGVGGYVRMFALKGSIPYYAPRDGSGYVSHALGKVNYGDTKYIVTDPEHDSNLYGYPNEDVLVTVCYK